MRRFGMRLEVVTDFDGTLMQQDVGDLLMEKLGVLKETSVIEVFRRFRNKEVGSMEVQRTLYGFLADRKEEVDRLLDGAYPREGAARFLAFCKTKGIPVTVLSDGMEYYIRRLLAKFGLDVERVVTNPISYLEDGGYRVGFQNDNAACAWCGCCKAGIVRTAASDGSRIVYIGDGSSDYFGSGFADWIFARGWLADKLEQEKETFYRFRDFHDIRVALEADLDGFRRGTAARRRGNPNTFCRFADPAPL